MCYWKLPCSSLICALKRLIFHSRLLVYQRASPYPVSKKCNKNIDGVYVICMCNVSGRIELSVAWKKSIKRMYSNYIRVCVCVWNVPIRMHFMLWFHISPLNYWGRQNVVYTHVWLGDVDCQIQRALQTSNQWRYLWDQSVQNREGSDGTHLHLCEAWEVAEHAWRCPSSMWSKPNELQKNLGIWWQMNITSRSHSDRQIQYGAVQSSRFVSSK